MFKGLHIINITVPDPTLKWIAFNELLSCPSKKVRLELYKNKEQAFKQVL